MTGNLNPPWRGSCLAMQLIQKPPIPCTPSGCLAEKADSLQTALLWCVVSAALKYGHVVLVIPQELAASGLPPVLARRAYRASDVHFAYRLAASCRTRL